MALFTGSSADPSVIANPLLCNPCRTRSLGINYHQGPRVADTAPPTWQRPIELMPHQSADAGVTSITNHTHHHNWLYRAEHGHVRVGRALVGQSHASCHVLKLASWSTTAAAASSKLPHQGNTATYVVLQQGRYTCRPGHVSVPNFGATHTIHLGHTASAPATHSQLPICACCALLHSSRLVVLAYRLLYAALCSLRLHPALNFQ